MPELRFADELAPVLRVPVKYCGGKYANIGLWHGWLAGRFDFRRQGHEYDEPDGPC